MKMEAERKAIAGWKAKKANQSGELISQKENDDDKDIYAQENEWFGAEVREAFVVPS